MDFRRVLLILRSRWLMVLVTLLVVFGLAALVTLLTSKKYTATATVLAESRSTDPILGAAYGMQSTGYVATQIDIIGSDRVARRVVRTLQIDKLPNVVERWRGDGEGLGTVEAYAADLLLNNLTVAPGRDSNVIAINYTSPSPEFSATVANAFARAYIETSLELKVDPAREYAQWFNERTKQLRESLEAAQTRLTDYQQAKGIVVNDERLDVENARLAELTAQLATAQAQGADVSSRGRQAAGDMSTSPDVLQNPLIASVRGDILRQEAKLKELSGQLGQNHPLYQRAEAELGELKARLDAEMRRVTASMRSATQAGTQRQGELYAMIEAQKRRILDLRKEHNEIAVLRKDVESAQRAYDLVNQRLAQTNLESQTQQTNIAQLTTATPPAKASSPRVLRNLALGLVFGLALGIALAVLREMLDPRVRSVVDLVGIGTLPVLAVVHSGAPVKRRFLRLPKLKSSGSPALAP